MIETEPIVEPTAEGVIDEALEWFSRGAAAAEQARGRPVQAPRRLWSLEPGKRQTLCWLTWTAGVRSVGGKVAAPYGMGRRPRARVSGRADQ